MRRSWTWCPTTTSWGTSISLTGIQDPSIQFSTSTGNLDDDDDDDDDEKDDDDDDLEPSFILKIPDNLDPRSFNMIFSFYRQGNIDNDDDQDFDCFDQYHP